MTSRTSIDFEQARFLKSAATLSQCPGDDGMEVAICGRSNAGKSSALNYLTGQRKLARTSKTPGRTQLLNFFRVTDDFRLVDLPGYGYARVPEAMKAKWHEQIDAYLRCRECLKGLILVMDIRHPLKEFDLMMIDWSTESGVPLHILLTKCDKLKRGARNAALFGVRKALPDGVTVQLFSSPEEVGREELTRVMNE
ncbi:MAG: YihA family ribosome biogenesis GTP-binding protein, partial [Pseudomonadales bacterium]|nr:YihA family ribosome biogenesis GTP-binding protein [Pseudomonadales bacterium]